MERVRKTLAMALLVALPATACTAAPRTDPTDVAITTTLAGAPIQMDRAEAGCRPQAGGGALFDLDLSVTGPPGGQGVVDYTWNGAPVQSTEFVFEADGTFTWHTFLPVAGSGEVWLDGMEQRTRIAVDDCAGTAPPRSAEVQAACNDLEGVDLEVDIRGQVGATGIAHLHHDGLADAVEFGFRIGPEGMFQLTEITPTDGYGQLEVGFGDGEILDPIPILPACEQP